MNLVIDIGNTRAKVFVFEGNKLVKDYSFPKLTVTPLKKIFSTHKPAASILSSVIKGDEALKSFLKKHSTFIELSHKTLLPLKNLYKTKETLGNDRIANAVAASKTYPGSNCLVIDAGTCIKYDFVNAENEYLGGAISPGMMMRYESLHRFTDKLPLVKPVDDGKYLGASTKESIRSGVQQGILSEMIGYVLLFHKNFGELKVIITGGDADCFAHLFNFPIFAAPKLTAKGLNDILQHNLPKK